jgi:hypothetical protein
MPLSFARRQGIVNKGGGIRLHWVAHGCTDEDALVVDGARQQLFHCHY